MTQKKTASKARVGHDAVGGALLQAFVDLIDAGDARAQLILNALVRFANWRTGIAFPNYETLADISKCSRKTIQRRLRKMAMDGLITIDPRHETDGNGRQTSNAITLVGYEEWYAAVNAGGTVRKPTKVRGNPPGQVDQGGPGPSDQRALGNLTRGTGHQVATPLGQQVSTLEPSHELSLGTLSPRSPRKRGSREGDDLIADVRAAKPACARAVDKLLAPLLATVKFDAPNPVFAAGTVAEFAEKQTDAVLDEALRQLTEPGKHYRRHNAKPSDISDAIRTARELVATREAIHKRGPLLWRDTADFNAAIAKVAEVDPAYAETLRLEDRIPRTLLKPYGIEQMTCTRRC